MKIQQKEQKTENVQKSSKRRGNLETKAKLAYNRNMTVYKDNCIGITPYATLNVDLLSELIANKKLRENSITKTKTGNEKYLIQFSKKQLKKLDNNLYNHFSDKSIKLTTGFLCRLKNKDTFLIGGYVYRNYKQLNINKINQLEEKLFIINQKDIYPIGVKVFDHTLTGGVVFPCGFSENKTKQDYFEWKCILGQAKQKDKMGVEYKTWRVDYSGNIVNSSTFTN